MDKLQCFRQQTLYGTKKKWADKSWKTLQKFKCIIKRSNSILNVMHCTIPTTWHYGKGKTMKKTSGKNKILMAASGWGEREVRGAQRFLSQFNHSMWCHKYGWISYTCQNAWNIHQEWILTYTLELVWLCCIDQGASVVAMYRSGGREWQWGKWLCAGPELSRKSLHSILLDQHNLFLS